MSKFKQCCFLMFLLCGFGVWASEARAATHEVGPGQTYPTLHDWFTGAVISANDVINLHADDQSLRDTNISMPDKLTFRSADGTMKTISQAAGAAVDRGGIFRFDADSTMEFENVRLQGAEVVGSYSLDGGQGAAIYVYQNAYITANNVEFLDNTAYGGTTTEEGALGAAILANMNLVLDGWNNVLLQNNRVIAADNSERSALGGTIFTQSGQDTGLSMQNITNVSFIENQAQGSSTNNGSANLTGLGGAVAYLDLWSSNDFFLTGTNILFDGNQASSGTSTGTGYLIFSGLGGAIFSNQPTTMTGVTFTNNKALSSTDGEMTTGLGGAIYYAGPELTLQAENGNNILFRGNIHNPGNTGETPNSIYFGAYDEDPTANDMTFTVSVDGNSLVEMYDPLGSQADDLLTGSTNTARRTNLTIDKTGAGDWVLGGHNLMESSTTWNVNQGRLILDMVNANPVHIDLRSQNTSAFNLASGAAILVNPGTEAHMISARDINFAAGSSTGLWKGGAFTYDQLPVDAEIAMFSLRATDSLVNESTILNPDGTFSSGIYDYEYGLYWRENDGLSQDLVAFLRGETKTRNEQRSGASAITASGAASRTAQGAINQIYQKRLALNFRCLDDCPETIYPATCPDGLSNDCDRQYELWATPSYNYVDSSSESNYRISSPGIGVGIDGCFDNNFFLGLGVFAFWPEYRSDYADVDARSLNFMLYGGTRLPAGLELGLNAGFGYSWYEQQRYTNGERYDSEYDSKSWNLGANLGRRFDLDESWELRPFIDYQYVRIEVDGYREDPGLYALNVDKHDIDLHMIRAGTDLTYDINNTHFIRGRVFYSGLHGDTRPEAKVKFVLDPSQTSYTSYGDRQDRDALGLGLDGAIRISEAVELAARYEVELGDNVTSHFGSLSFIYKF